MICSSLQHVLRISIMHCVKISLFSLGCEKLQNLPYFIDTKTQIWFFHFSFCASTLFFSLRNTLVYVDIDQGIYCNKSKVARNEQRKKLFGFSYFKIIANFEVFVWSVLSSTNSEIVRSTTTISVTTYKHIIIEFSNFWIKFTTKFCRIWNWRMRLELPELSEMNWTSNGSVPTKCIYWRQNCKATKIRWVKWSL